MNSGALQALIKQFMYNTNFAVLSNGELCAHSLKCHYIYHWHRNDIRIKFILHNSRNFSLCVGRNDDFIAVTRKYFFFDHCAFSDKFNEAATVLSNVLFYFILFSCCLLANNAALLQNWAAAVATTAKRKKGFWCFFHGKKNTQNYPLHALKKQNGAQKMWEKKMVCQKTLNKWYEILHAFWYWRI